jgi:hypothetical protein
MTTNMALTTKPNDIWSLDFLTIGQSGKVRDLTMTSIARIHLATDEDPKFYDTGHDGI